MPLFRLSSLKKGDRARITRIFEERGSALSNRLLEMGFLENVDLEVLHEAPLGGDPLAVRVRGSVIALRRSEASVIEVSIL